jgi:hypothetical protein
VELFGEKVLLRLQDEFGWNPPPEEDSAAEIRRVLEGLGYEPDALDLMEFQERLARFHPHGSLPGLQPTDIWVLAILWTRGLRQGADAFALTSFYLRRQSLHDTQGSFLPDMAALIQALDGPQAVSPEIEQPLSEWITPDPVGCLVSGLENHNRECLKFLNREGSTVGHYRVSETLHSLDLRQENVCRYRWTNNPVNPGYVLETVRSAGEITATLHLLCEDPARETPVKIWHNLWTQVIEASELRGVEFKVVSYIDKEQLRFAFWRKWFTPEGNLMGTYELSA